MDRRADVLVVGGGPAGATSAVLLARLGLRTLLVDRATFPRRKACAEYMSPGVEDALTELGLAAAVDVLGPLRVPGMDIVAPNGSHMCVQYHRHGQTAWARTVTRERLDEALVRAAAREGAEVLERVTVRDPLVEAGTMRGVTAATGGRELRLEATLTVIADGARSRLASKLGIAARPKWPVRLGLVAHYSGPGRLRDGFGEMHVAREGYCGVAPLPGDQLNVAMVTSPDALRLARLSAGEYMDRWIGTHPPLRRLLDGCRRVDTVRGVVPIGSRVRRAHIPGALLVGDAAGFFDPFTGEGIHRALRGAEMVAAVASGALAAGDVSETYLAQYDSMRRRAFMGKQAVTALVQTFVQYPRLMEYALPRISVRASALGSLSSVLGDIAPPRDFLNPSTLWTALHP